MYRSRPPRTPRLPPLEAKGEKPVFFFFVVALLNVVDSFNLNIVWPLLPFMVDSYGVARTEEDLGAWVGAAGAAVSVGQLLSSYAWGALSDRIGRRPVMLMGMCNSTFSVLVFGTARSYAQCLAGRFLSGLLNGNAGVVKTYVGEVTEKSQQTMAFSIFAMAFGFASCVAPAIGGFLQRPAERWPGVFGDTVFETFPFLLPMLCAAALTSVGGVLGFLYAPETASQWRRMQKRRAERERAAERRRDGKDGDVEAAADRRAARDGEALLRAAADDEKRGGRTDGPEVELARLDDSGVSQAVFEPEYSQTPKLQTKQSPLSRGAGAETYETHSAEEDDDETRLLPGTAAVDGFVDGRRAFSRHDDDTALSRLRQHGWDAHTVTAASSYAVLAFIAIGYDEILPVYAKTREDLGGLHLSASQIGIVLVVGGVALILFQIFAFPVVLKRLGVTKALRSASLAFACVALVAPVASVRGVVEDPAAKWFALLLSQTLKIVTLAVLFTTVIMAVNNSCLNRVKARVNGAATSCAALGRIVSPIAHGVVFSASLRLHETFQQFLVFAFVSACALGLFALTSRLPTRLDQPPREAEDERAVGAEETNRS